MNKKTNEDVVVPVVKVGLEKHLNRAAVTGLVAMKIL